jgi:hypothetical protein
MVKITELNVEGQHPGPPMMMLRHWQTKTSAETHVRQQIPASGWEGCNVAMTMHWSEYGELAASTPRPGWSECMHSCTNFVHQLLSRNNSQQKFSRLDNLWPPVQSTTR